MRYFEIFLPINGKKLLRKKILKDELRNRMLNEIFHETVPAILHEEDLNAMYYSVENRLHFLIINFLRLVQQYLQNI